MILISKKQWQKALWLFLAGFILMNIIAFAHAYRFTHFTHRDTTRIKDPGALSWREKIKILFMGIDNPKPENQYTPDLPFERVALGGPLLIRGWYIHSTISSSKGTVILFHGYAGEKSSLLERAKYFNALGYHTLLIDFLGSGESDGYSTSIGYHEAGQVKTCVDYIRSKGETNIFLFGTSMGSAAILKAISDDYIKPSAIIIECPFGSLYKTVCARFELMHLPSFPMAGLLTFWGGVQHGYWAFAHNPSEYAKSVSCPTLLLFGEQDDRVTIEEIQRIYFNLKGIKRLRTYSREGHTIFSSANQSLWQTDVNDFLQEINE